ncbi:MAG: RsmE family RNA methyltransferase [Candidatus Aquicultorales bacterium]
MKKARRFFTEPGAVSGSEVVLTGPDVHHIRSVLRLDKGSMLEAVDSKNGVFLIEIIEAESDRILCRVRKRLSGPSTRPLVVLFQGIPKGSKMDELIRGAVEAGADAIVPVVTERTVPDLTEEKAAKRLNRWRRIAEEASKQSRRDHIVEVEEVRTLDQVLSRLEGFDSALIFWEEERDSTPREVLSPEARSIAIIIGPEGGLSVEEVLAMEAAGGVGVTMGETLFRTETAGVVATAIVRYELMKGRLKKS